jgi:hypothetical protein
VQNITQNEFKVKIYVYITGTFFFIEKCLHYNNSLLSHLVADIRKNIILFHCDAIQRYCHYYTAVIHY